MIPTVIDCWVDNIKLVYDEKTHTTHNAKGVQVRVPGFGNTSTVEYLDESKRGFSSYFAPIAKRLTSLGYVRGVNMHGAPYDFRKAANELQDYFVELKSLVESTSKENGGKPVVLIAHSMGCIMSLYFLNHQTQAWKDQYIRSVVTLSGVWGGTVRALKVFAMGDNLGAWIISGTALKIEQRGNPSLAWLMPSEAFWGKDEVIVESKEANITAHNVTAFYRALGHPENVAMLSDVRPLVRDLTHPGVDVYCMHGTGVPTTEKLTYSSFPSSTPTLTKGDGDGTVNQRSLLGCKRWEGSAKHKFQHKMFDKVDHLQILKDDAATEYVKNIVQSFIDEDGGGGGSGGNHAEPEEEVIPQIEII